MRRADFACDVLAGSRRNRTATIRHMHGEFARCAVVIGDRYEAELVVGIIQTQHNGLGVCGIGGNIHPSTAVQRVLPFSMRSICRIAGDRQGGGVCFIVAAAGFTLVVSCIGIAKRCSDGGRSYRCGGCPFVC